MLTCRIRSAIKLGLSYYYASVPKIDFFCVTGSSSPGRVDIAESFTGLEIFSSQLTHNAGYKRTCTDFKIRVQT